MTRTTVGHGIEIEYESFGDPSDPTLLVVSGYTSQLLGWDVGLVDQLVAQGLRVVRFDNRDVGLSTKLDGVRVSPMKVMRTIIDEGVVPDVPYRLSDMASDAVGLLDHLGVDRAHVAGVSMGGMIVQTMAIEHPDRIASLTSIMSTTGDHRVGQATAEARDALLAAPPRDRDAYVDASERAKVWASNRHFDVEYVRARAGADYDRSYYPEGATRQLAAIYASGDRTEGLAALDVPTLVIHGRDDTLIQPSGGEQTAALVAGSKYLLLSDMGHDLPVPLWPVLAEAIGGHIRTAA
ncbi:MAG: alpha/beta fold hydrolase [Actinomycetota bacterium]